MALPQRGKGKERPVLTLDLMLPMTVQQLHIMVAKLGRDIEQYGYLTADYIVTAAMDHSSGRVTLTATPRVP